MKKNIKVTSLLLPLLIPVFLFSQTLDEVKNKKEIIPLLSHNWKADLKTDSTVVLYPPPETFSSIHFFADGSVSMNTLTDAKGTWSYDVKTRTLILTFSDHVLKWNLIKLTDKEMIFKSDRNKISKEVRLWRIEES